MDFIAPLIIILLLIAGVQALVKRRKEKQLEEYERKKGWRNGN